jgi:hypothetical protein
MLGSLRRAGFFNDAGLNGYRRWTGTIARKQYATLGFDPRQGAYTGAEPEVVQSRETMVSNLVFAGDAPVKETLAAAAAAYLAGDTKALDPAYMGPAFQAYLDKGGAAAAKTLADKGLASDDPTFRPAALGAVAGSGDEATARWVLNEWQDKRLRPVERLYAVAGVAGTLETRDLGYDYIAANLPDMMKGGAGLFLARSLPSVLAGYCSVEKADDMARRFRPMLAGTPGALELERTIERVRNCGTLKTARGAELSAALAAK